MLPGALGDRKRLATNPGNIENQWGIGKKGPYWGAETTNCSPELTNAAFPRRRASPWNLWAGAGQRLGPGSASSGGSRGAGPGWAAGPRTGERCPPPPAPTGSSAPRGAWRACRDQATPSAGGAGTAAPAARSVHLFCPERAWGLGTKTEIYNLGQGLRSKSRRAAEGSSDHAPLGNVPSSRPARSGLFPESDGSRAKTQPPCAGAGCLGTARTSHLPPPLVSAPSIEAAKEGKERSNSPVLPTRAARTRTVDPRPPLSSTAF